MAIETIAEEGVCLRLKNQRLKLGPDERPQNCGDCYSCLPDPVNNPRCSGNPKNCPKPCEVYFG